MSRSFRCDPLVAESPAGSDSGLCTRASVPRALTASVNALVSAIGAFDRIPPRTREQLARRIGPLIRISATEKNERAGVSETGR
jgi:hypothetical protein